LPPLRSQSTLRANLHSLLVRVLSHLLDTMPSPQHQLIVGCLPCR
jgi:hypothetical protein